MRQAVAYCRLRCDRVRGDSERAHGLKAVPFLDARGIQRDVIGGNFRPAAPSGSVVVCIQVDGKLLDVRRGNARQVIRKLVGDV